MKKYVLALVLALAPGPALAQTQFIQAYVPTTVAAAAGITVDTSESTSGIGTLTINTTVSTGNYMMAGAMYTTDNNGTFVDSVKWGTAHLARLDTTVRSEAQAVDVWALANPAAGTANLVFYFHGAGTDRVGTVVVFNGVDTADPYSASVEGVGVANPQTINITSAVGELCVGFVFVGSENPAVGAGQTGLATNSSPPVYGEVSSEAGAASVTISWTTTLDRGYCLQVYSLKPQ